MAWVSIPDLVVHLSHQRYTAAGPGPRGGAYIEFTVTQLDMHGFVVDYPGIAPPAASGGAATEGPGGPPSPEPAPPPDDSPATSPAEEAPVTGEVPDSMLDPVLADAAERTGAATDALDVTRAEQVQWSDGSLGCPEPGMFYTQAIVLGYHVEVTAPGGIELDYRLDDRGRFRLCDTGPFTRPGSG